MAYIYNGDELDKNMLMLLELQQRHFLIKKSVNHIHG